MSDTTPTPADPALATATKVLTWLQVITALVRVGKVTIDEVRQGIHTAAGSDYDTAAADAALLAELHDAIADSKAVLERS